MSDGPSGRPGQPGRPHRFYFDDLADELPDEQPVADEPDEPEPAAPVIAHQSRDDGDDDLVDTGPIQVIRDPVPGSAAGQQLYFDDLAPLQHASAGDSAPQAEPFDDDEHAAEGAAYGKPAYAGLAGGSSADGDDEEPPVRGALALAAARKPRPVGAVIAVLAVLALIGVLAAVGGRGSSGHHKQDAAAVRNAPSTADPSSAPATQPSASASAPATTPASPGSSAPTHRKVVPGRAPVGVALTVLNNTTTKGLAKSAAQVFSTRGWQVGTVGNYAGQISVTTVYYNSDDAAQRKAAQTLAAQFPGVAQVQPRFASLPGAGLTVVLAPDWHA